MRYSVEASALENAILAGDEGRLVEELRNLKSQRSPRLSRVAKAIQILEQTNSSRVRNAAALALSDLRAKSSKDTLINLLTRPDTKGSRGTLLYALEQLGADVPLPILSGVIVEESYEAREEALAIIARNRIECSAEEFACARARLEAGRASADGERSQAIRRALEFLKIKHRNYARDKGRIDWQTLGLKRQVAPGRRTSTASERTMPRRIPEPELVIPTLELLEAAPNGEMRTADLIQALEEMFRPTGEDATLLEQRADTKFSQKVRNLKSHKTLQKAGLAEAIYRGFRITPAGRRLIDSLKR